MANQIRISAERMKSDDSRLQELLKELPSAIQNLETCMETLAGCWEGAAWSAFQEQVASDMENMNELYKLLQTYEQNLQSGRVKYLRAEFHAYTKVKSIWVGL